MARSPTSAAIAAAPSDRRATFLDADGTRCACGGKRRPGVVLFGEALPAAVLRGGLAGGARARGCSWCWARRCWSRPRTCCLEAAAAAGAPLVIVNRDPTPLDGAAALVIAAAIGETLRAVDALLPRPQPQGAR